MGRAIFVPDNEKFWTDFYLLQAKQTGHGFQGIPYQRGHGLGSFFGRLFRAILPVAKRVGKSAIKTVGKEAMNMGASVVGDVVHGGKNFEESLKEHGGTAVRNLANKTAKAIVKNQSGGLLGKRNGGPSKTSATNRKKAKKVDYLGIIEQNYDDDDEELEYSF